MLADVLNGFSHVLAQISQVIANVALLTSKLTCCLDEVLPAIAQVLADVLNGFSHILAQISQVIANVALLTSPGTEIEAPHTTGQLDAEGGASLLPLALLRDRVARCSVHHKEGRHEDGEDYDGLHSVEVLAKKKRTFEESSGKEIFYK